MNNYQQSFIRRCFMHGEECNLKEKLKINSKQVFVVMPFRGKDNVFFAIKDAVKKSNYEFERADLEHSNIFNDSLQSLPENSEFTIYYW